MDVVPVDVVVDVVDVLPEVPPALLATVMAAFPVLTLLAVVV